MILLFTHTQMPAPMACQCGDVIDVDDGTGMWWLAIVVGVREIAEKIKVRAACVKCPHPFSYYTQMWDPLLIVALRA